MKRIDYIIKSNTAPEDKNVLWLHGEVIKTFVDGEWVPIVSDGFPKIRKVSEFIHKVDYDRLDYNAAMNYLNEENIFTHAFGCSAFRKNNFFCRNYDWYYDYSPTFVVTTPAYDNKYATLGVANGVLNQTFNLSTTLINRAMKVMPFYILDGINEKGVFCSLNVVPIDKGATTKTAPLIEERDRICNVILGRYIIDNFASADEAIDYLKNYVTIYASKALQSKGYEIHYLIGDKDKTYVVEIVNNQIVAKEHSVMTNFFIDGVTFNEDGTIYTAADIPTHYPRRDNGITYFGAGLERYNTIINNLESVTTKEAAKEVLKDIYFTNAYNAESLGIEEWYSDFVGVYKDRVITVDSTPEEVAPIIDKARELYEHRDRNIKNTWQTVHSSIYNIESRTLYITAQEGDIEYRFVLDGEILNSGEGTNDHAELINRDAANQHPISAITGLQGALEGKYEKPSSGIPESDLSSGVQTKLNAKEVFVAEYGVTTYAEIMAAYNEGKVVICFYDGLVYYLHSLIGRLLPQLISVLGNSVYSLIIDGNNGWQVLSYNLEERDFKVSSWQSTPDNNHYPSEKLVKDSLDEKVSYVSQTLTDAQKVQARENIGAAANKELILEIKYDAVNYPPFQAASYDSVTGQFTTASTLPTWVKREGNTRVTISYKDKYEYARAIRISGNEHSFTIAYIDDTHFTIAGASVPSGINCSVFKFCAVAYPSEYKAWHPSETETEYYLYEMENCNDVTGKSPLSYGLLGSATRWDAGTVGVIGNAELSYIPRHTIAGRSYFIFSHTPLAKKVKILEGYQSAVQNNNGSLRNFATPFSLSRGTEIDLVGYNADDNYIAVGTVNVNDGFRWTEESIIRIWRLKNYIE